MLLSHQAGLCSFREPAVAEDFYDQPAATARFASTTPIWPPGSRSGYHAISIGIPAGQLFLRIEGRSLGRFIAEKLSGPMSLQLMLGLPASDAARRGEIIAPSEMATSNRQAEMNPSQVAAFTSPRRLWVKSAEAVVASSHLEVTTQPASVRTRCGGSGAGEDGFREAGNESEAVKRLPAWQDGPGANDRLCAPARNSPTSRRRRTAI